MTLLGEKQSLCLLTSATMLWCSSLYPAYLWWREVKETREEDGGKEEEKEGLVSP